YQKITTAAYRDLVSSAAFKLSDKNLSTLLHDIESADQSNNPDRVIGLALTNMAVIQQNINAKELATISRLILKHHGIGTVQEILSYAKKNADRHAQATQHFELARYYSSRNQWDDAIAQLKMFDLSEDV